MSEQMSQYESAAKLPPEVCLYGAPDGGSGHIDQDVARESMQVSVSDVKMRPANNLQPGNAKLYTTSLCLCAWNGLKYVFVLLNKTPGKELIDFDSPIFVPSIEVLKVPTWPHHRPPLGIDQFILVNNNILWFNYPFILFWRTLPPIFIYIHFGTRCSSCLAVVSQRFLDVHLIL